MDVLANVIESDIPLFHLGQPVQVKVMAYPKRVFQGEVSKIYAAVDPNTHRITMRSEIADPKDELRPGMLANFVIRVDGPSRSGCCTSERCGARTRWHDGGLGHHRSPAFVRRVVRQVYGKTTKCRFSTVSNGEKSWRPATGRYS